MRMKQTPRFSHEIRSVSPDSREQCDVSSGICDNRCPLGYAGRVFVLALAIFPPFASVFLAFAGAFHHGVHLHVCGRLRCRRGPHTTC